MYEEAEVWPPKFSKYRKCQLRCKEVPWRLKNGTAVYKLEFQGEEAKCIQARKRVIAHESRRFKAAESARLTFLQKEKLLKGRITTADVVSLAIHGDQKVTRELALVQSLSIEELEDSAKLLLSLEDGLGLRLG